MARGKKSPTLKDAISHKTNPPKLLPGAVGGSVASADAISLHPNTTAEGQVEKAQNAVKQQLAVKAGKRLPTLEEIVAKLAQHGIHFDKE